MKRITLAIISIVLVSLLTPAAAAPPEDNMVKVIIGFKDKPDVTLIESYGGKVRYQYKIIPAVAAEVPSGALYGLSHNPGIDIIEPDGKAYSTTQTVPWGIERIQAPAVHARDNRGSGINIAIIDTGMDYSHPDLAANYMGGYDFFNRDPDPMDDNGHGTHVAGIIGALDNDIGVIGASPQVNIYTLKVLDASGSGYYSDIISALEWASTNGMDAASMSLGGSVNSIFLEQACDNAYNSGVVLVAAAGNNNGPVLYPAAYDSVIAVAATDSSANGASYSNFGSQVELAAPGNYINSTYLGGGYGLMSGTSMATPHVTGTVALVLHTPVAAGYDANGNGLWDPPEVRQRLHDTAIDLGSPGRDNFYGYGLVNASAAAEVASSPVPSGDELHVGDILMDTAAIIRGRGSIFNYATAAVHIVNTSGSPVSGATVYGHWSGLTADTDSGTTDQNGNTTLASDSTKKTGTFTFTVDNVVHSALTYNSSANTVTSSSITVSTAGSGKKQAS